MLIGKTDLTGCTSCLHTTTGRQISNLSETTNDECKTDWCKIVFSTTHPIGSSCYCLQAELNEVMHERRLSQIELA